jgi:hypothetical protein
MKKDEKCWLCRSEEPDTMITVERETPNGKSCKPKDVFVHFGCYMDMDN